MNYYQRYDHIFNNANRIEITDNNVSFMENSCLCGFADYLGYNRKLLNLDRFKNINVIVFNCSPMTLNNFRCRYFNDVIYDFVKNNRVKQLIFDEIMFIKDEPTFNIVSGNDE